MEPFKMLLCKILCWKLLYFWVPKCCCFVYFKAVWKHNAFGFVQINSNYDIGYQRCPFFSRIKFDIRGIFHSKNAFLCFSLFITPACRLLVSEIPNFYLSCSFKIILNFIFKKYRTLDFFLISPVAKFSNSLKISPWMCISYVSIMFKISPSKVRKLKKYKEIFIREEIIMGLDH